MVSRTRIPTGMFPVGGSETDPTPRTATPSAITKDGSGEPINEEMIQDYPCGDETGHYFISSPLNVYSIGRSGAVVLYVEGGCPNFTWASDNAWATFGTAETSVRYNTISSTSAEGEDTVVTVTDTNGLEVTISVPWNGATACCEDPPALSIQTSVAEIVDFVTWEVVVFIDGGCPPFAWEATGVGGVANLDYAATNSRRNRISGTTTCFTLTVTDLCDQTATVGIGQMSVLDSYEFDDSNCIEPSPIHLSGDYYAVVYQGPSNHGWLKTLRITTAGAITGVDEWEFDIGSTEHHHIDYISGVIYALSYEIGNNGYLKTLNISNTGVITKSFLDDWDFGGRLMRQTHLFNVSGSVYTFIVSSPYSRQYIYTCSISSLGQITPIDSYHYATIGYFTYGHTQVNSNIYFAVISGDTYFEVWTIHVADNGTITVPYRDSQAFTDSNPGHAPLNVAEVTTGVFAIPLWHNDGYSGLGHVHTFSVNASGDIGNTLLDSYEFGASGLGACRGTGPDIRKSDTGNIFFVAYIGIGADENNNDGIIDTVAITNAGVITDYGCGSLEFETGVMASPQVLSVHGDCLPIFYTGSDSDGWITTIGDF